MYTPLAVAAYIPLTEDERSKSHLKLRQVMQLLNDLSILHQDSNLEIAFEDLMSGLNYITMSLNVPQTKAGSKLGIALIAKSIEQLDKAIQSLKLESYQLTHPYLN